MLRPPARRRSCACRSSRRRTSRSKSARCTACRGTPGASRWCGASTRGMGTAGSASGRRTRRRWRCPAAPCSPSSARASRRSSRRCCLQQEQEGGEGRGGFMSTCGEGEEHPKGLGVYAPLHVKQHDIRSTSESLREGGREGGRGHTTVRRRRRGVIMPPGDRRWRGRTAASACRCVRCRSGRRRRSRPRRRSTSRTPTDRGSRL